MGNSILSWRRVRALCVKETRQTVRDPSSWLIAVVIPLLLIVIVLILTKAGPLFRSLQERTDALNLVVQENLTGIRVVKSFVRED